MEETLDIEMEVYVAKYINYYLRFCAQIEILQCITGIQNILVLQITDTL